MDISQSKAFLSVHNYFEAIQCVCLVFEKDIVQNTVFSQLSLFLEVNKTTKHCVFSVVLVFWKENHCKPLCFLSFPCFFKNSELSPDGSRKLGSGAFASESFGNP